MINIKLTIAYEGTGYLGWQRLSGDLHRQSIQGILEDVLEEIFGCNVQLVGSGRTDSGVHAKGQVANFHVPAALLHLCTNLREECNCRLPASIRILQVQQVSKAFHSRYSAKRKTYEYQIDTRKVQQVFLRKYALWVPEELSVAKMRQAAAVLIGTHDFESFCTKAPDKKRGRPTERTVERLDIREEDDRLVIEICGNGFLYHMVRIIVGTLLEVGTGARTIKQVEEALEKKDRRLAGKTVSSVGLYLKEVSYDREQPCFHTEKENGSHN